MCKSVIAIPLNKGLVCGSDGTCQVDSIVRIPPKKLACRSTVDLFVVTTLESQEKQLAAGVAVVKSVAKQVTTIEIKVALIAEHSKKIDCFSRRKMGMLSQFRLYTRLVANKALS